MKSRTNGIFFAGGTYIMNQQNYLKEEDTIIDLSNIKELDEITRNIQFVDVGCMVTANKLLDIGKLAFTDLLLDTLHNTATHIIRNQITIGGALCTPDIRYSLPGTLSIMNTVVELLDLSQDKLVSKFIPIDKLYNTKGELQIEKGVLLKKIRISLDNYDFEKFFCIGDPIRKPESTLIISFRANIDQTILNKVNMCVTFPTCGMYISNEIAQELIGAQLPLTISRTIIISEKITNDIKKEITGISALQIERCKRLIQSILFEIEPNQESIEISEGLF
ncbi:MAG: FAD binding domain-containing protein [Spirochaetaceae bacterium]|nr:FAD binding domain-containing protein [Spirochaetaceae bacterium]